MFCGSFLYISVSNNFSAFSPYGSALAYSLYEKDEANNLFRQLGRRKKVAKSNLLIVKLTKVGVDESQHMAASDSKFLVSGKHIP